MAAYSGNRTNVRVVVVGDEGTGKSSLIMSVGKNSIMMNVPKVMPLTRLPGDYYYDPVPITIIDTCSSPEHRAKLIAECQKADAVVLTYACDRPSTFDRLSTYWLPELRRLEVKAPVIVVGCKLDLLGKQPQVSLKWVEQRQQVMSPIMQEFWEVEKYIECSALKRKHVSQDLGIEAPIHVSMKLGEHNHVFRRIISAAQHPHLNIPEIEAGKRNKQYRRLMFVAVGLAVAQAGLAAYRAYEARKATSG